MSFLSIVADAAAAAAPAGQTAAKGEPNGLITMIPFIIIIAAMFFFTMRSQKKQQQKFQSMIEKIVKGTRVLLKSGMYGSIVEVKKDSFVVEIAPNTRVEVVKNGIADVVVEEQKAEVAK